MDNIERDRKLNSSFLIDSCPDVAGKRYVMSSAFGIATLCIVLYLVIFNESITQRMSTYVYLS